MNYTQVLFAQHGWILFSKIRKVVENFFQLGSFHTWKNLLTVGIRTKKKERKPNLEKKIRPIRWKRKMR